MFWVKAASFGRWLAHQNSTPLGASTFGLNISSWRHFHLVIIGNLSKHDGNGWQECHKTKGLISKTMTLHVQYRFWYISLPSPAKQQHEMTKFKVLCRTWTHDREFSFFYLNCNAVLTKSASTLFGYIRQFEGRETVVKKFEAFGTHF